MESAAIGGTVLCPVDLNGHSHAALRSAAGLVDDASGRLVVLHVTAGAGGGPEVVASAQADLRACAETALPAWFSHGSRASLLVRNGDPCDAILAVARESRASLIVMGTHGRGTLGRTLLGSTTAQVLRRSPVAVAVVPPSHDVPQLTDVPSAEHRFGLILVPVDLSDVSSRQLACAARLSVMSERRLFLLHVVPDGADRRSAQTRLEELARQIPAVRGCRVLVREGFAPEDIVHVTQHDRIDVVVLGRSSDRPGSVALELLHRAGAIVVVVP